MELDFKYKARFSAVANAIQVDESTQKLATASLRNLAKVFDDEEIIEKIDENPDLLFISSALILLNEFNLNGDGILAEDLVPIADLFADKFFDKNHDRSQGAFGAICETSYNIFGSNELVDEDSVLERAINERVQLVIGGYLWRLIDKELCDLIEESSALDDKKISTSFELLFNNYYIGIYDESNPSIFAAQIIKPDDENWAKYDKMLLANGGTGKLGDKSVGRILKPGILPAGAGIVVNPASGIKGILAVDSSMIEVSDDELTEEMGNQLDETECDGDPLCDLEMEDGLVISSVTIIDKKTPTYIKAKSIKNLIVKNKKIKEIQSSVSNLNSTLMEIKSLDDIKLDLFKNEAQANEVRTFIEKNYVEAAKEYASKLEAKELEAKNAAEARQIAETAVTEFKDKYAALAEELKTLRAEQAAVANEVAFNTRMSALDEVFEFDDEDRSLIVDEVKLIDSDESFAKYMDKQKKLMKEKTKAFKADKKEKDAKAALEVSKVNVKEVVASLVENPNQELSNGVPVVASLKDQLAAALKKNVTIGGKTKE